MVNPKKHPADLGLQVARIYSALLKRGLGNSLKAVYVHGSTASGMRLPQSDVDIIIVRDFSPKEVALIDPNGIESKTALAVGKRFGIDLQIAPLDTHEFIKMQDPKYLPNRRLFSFGVRALRKGAVPIFARKDFIWKYGRNVPKPTNVEKKYYESRARENAAKRIRLRKNWKRRIKPRVI